MKRINAFLLLLVLIFTLSACNNSADDINEEAQGSFLPSKEISVEEVSDDTEQKQEPLGSAETNDPIPESENLPVQTKSPETSSLTDSEDETNHEPVENDFQVETKEEAENLPVQTEAPETSSLTDSEQQTNHGSVADDSQVETKEDAEIKLTVQIGNSTFSATLEDNEAADAFVEMLEQSPAVIEMNDYSGFEKVGSLGQSLPASNSQTTTQTGDIVLYNGNQIVIFYGSNSWSYTRLGKIDDLSGWEEALGSGDVTVTFSIGG